MDLIKPEIGLLFWMLLSFSLVLFILRKYAWGPILQSLKEREEGIDSALKNAQIAREEIVDLKKNKDQILLDASSEKQRMMKDAQEYIEDWKKEQKQKIEEQINQNIARAQDVIEQQKRAAVTELKTQLASLSLGIAEKVIKKELSKDSAYLEMIRDDIKDLNIS
jgi:F-type H+-transporting ATPase subunit b